MQPAINEPTRNFVIGAWAIAAALLWIALRFDLLPALLAGLLVFELVHVQTMRLTFVRERRARWLAVALIAVIVVGLLSLAIFASLLFFQSETSGYVLLLKKSAEVIQSWRGLLPAWLVHSLPTDAVGLQGSIVAWLKEHLTLVQTFGKEGTTVLVRIVIGMVIGALIALRQADPPVDYRPLALALANRASRLRRGVPAGRVRADPDRRRQRGADRPLPGDRAAASGNSPAADQDDDRGDLRRRTAAGRRQPDLERRRRRRQPERLALSSRSARWSI